MKKKSFLYFATNYNNVLKIGHTTALYARKSQLKNIEGLHYFRYFEFKGDRVKRELYESLLRYAIESIYTVKPYNIDHFETNVDTIQKVDFAWDDICKAIEQEENNIKRAFKRKIDTNITGEL